MAAFVVAYALSPIDLIPDFIPVLGYIDDALVPPGLIWLTIRLLPNDLLAECRVKADDWMRRGEGKPRTWRGIALVVAIWVFAQRAGRASAALMLAFVLSVIAAWLWLWFVAWSGQ
ncbi:YkvA family protein [Variovorax gossypii]